MLAIDDVTLQQKLKYTEKGKIEVHEIIKQGDYLTSLGVQSFAKHNALASAQPAR
jgi:hypothetical protein